LLLLFILFFEQAKLGLAFFADDYLNVVLHFINHNSVTEVVTLSERFESVGLGFNGNFPFVALKYDLH